MKEHPEDSIRAAVENAEEVRDPLDDLVSRTRADAGAPFATDVLQRLAALRQEDRAGFKRLRGELKRAGCCRQTNRRKKASQRGAVTQHTNL